MQRLVALIAVIFTFATLAGTTLAHAHRYVSTPIVVLNHVDANNVSIPVIVQVQRGDVDLGSGIIMPVGSHYAIPTMIPQMPVTQKGDKPIAKPDTVAILWSGQVPLRPPKAA